MDKKTGRKRDDYDNSERARWALVFSHSVHHKECLGVSLFLLLPAWKFHLV